MGDISLSLGQLTINVVFGQSLVKVPPQRRELSRISGPAGADVPSALFDFTAEVTDRMLELFVHVLLEIRDRFARSVVMNMILDILTVDTCVFRR